MRIVKQNRFKTFGELHKEWTEAGIKASRATTHRRVKELAAVSSEVSYPGLRRRRTGLLPRVQSHLFRWEQVLYFIGNQGPRVWRKGGEAHSPSCLKSSVKFPLSVMFGVQCHLLVLVHCVCENQRHCTWLSIHFEALSCFLLLTSFLKMLISFSSRIWHLPTLPKAPKVG